MEPPFNKYMVSVAMFLLHIFCTLKIFVREVFPRTLTLKEVL